MVSLTIILIFYYNNELIVQTLLHYSFILIVGTFSYINI